MHSMESQDWQLEETSHFLHMSSLILSKAHSTASWRRGETKNLTQVTLNKTIARDNAPWACIRRLQERLVSWVTCFPGRRNLPNPFQVTQKGWKLQQIQQPETEENWRFHSKKAPSSLESCLFATCCYEKTAYKSIIRLHPISTAEAPCSLGDTTNCSVRTWQCGRSAPSLYPLLLHLNSGHKHRPRLLSFV